MNNSRFDSFFGSYFKDRSFSTAVRKTTPSTIVSTIRLRMEGVCLGRWSPLFDLSYFPQVHVEQMRYIMRTDSTFEADIYGGLSSVKGSVFVVPDGIVDCANMDSIPFFRCCELSHSLLVGCLSVLSRYFVIAFF